MVQHFPIETLKIDQSFVRDIATDADDATIAAAVIGMGRNPKLRVIAEGVRRHGKLAFLRPLQCDGGQGFHFSHPLPDEDFVLARYRLKVAATTTAGHLQDLFRI